MKREDIKKLATLCRVDVSDEEAADLAHDLEAILGYVSEIGEVATEERRPEAGVPRNVMREDNIPHRESAYTEDILREAPDTEDGYIKVKQILNE